MLDVAGQAAIDKAALVGGCVRLKLGVDAERLRREVDAMPGGFWGTTAGRVGVHRAAEAMFLRGYAPAQGELPVEDREALELVPYVRQIIEQLIPAKPLRCLLARLGPGVVVAKHIDLAPYFAKTLRLHVPVDTHDQAFMSCNGRCYVMRPGEVWVLNNSTVHGVWNAHASRSRTHLICDFLPSEELLALLAAGEHDLGQIRQDVDQQVAAKPTRGATADG